MPFQFYCPQGHLLEGHESQMGQQSQCPLCGSLFVMPVLPGASPEMTPGGPLPAGGWPGYGQQAVPGYGQPMPPGYAPPYPPGQFPPGQLPGYAGGYGAAAGTPPAGWPGYVQQQAQQLPQVGPSGTPGPAGTLPVDEQSSGFPFVQTEPQAEPASSTPNDASSVSAAAAPDQPQPEAQKPEGKQEPRIVTIPCPKGHELQTPMDMVNQDVLCPLCGAQFHLRYEDSIEFKQEQAELRKRRAENLNRAALKWSIISAVVIVLIALGMIISLVVRSHRDENYSPPDDTAAATQAFNERPFLPRCPAACWARSMNNPVRVLS